MNIEEAKKILEKFTTEHKLFNIKHSDGLEEAIETLLTAYEKEKEKNKELEDTLKQTQNSWYEDTKLIEKQSKEIEELKQIIKENTILVKDENGDYQELNIDIKNYISKDKIKAKIEEVSNGTYDAKIVLQSLLEKE